MTKYDILFNTRRLIYSSYLVGGIHTHSKNNAEVSTELYCNLKQLFSRFLS